MSSPPISLSQPSLFWPSVCLDPAQLAQARELTETLYHPDQGGGELASEDRDALRDRCALIDPVALASQYLFAVCADAKGRQLHAVFMPICQWERGGQGASWRLPIARLLPGEESFLYRGTWVVAGYEKPAQAPELAFELLRRGFVWDPDFQAHCDANVLRKSLAKRLRPLIEGRALSEAAQPGRAPKSSPRI